MMGTSGRARLTVIALDPLSVKATMYLAPISRAVLHAPRAIASATLVARDAYGELLEERALLGLDRDAAHHRRTRASGGRRSPSRRRA